MPPDAITSVNTLRNFAISASVPMETRIMVVSGGKRRPMATPFCEHRRLHVGGIASGLNHDEVGLRRNEFNILLAHPRTQLVAGMNDLGLAFLQHLGSEIERRQNRAHAHDADHVVAVRLHPLDQFGRRGDVSDAQTSHAIDLRKRAGDDDVLAFLHEAKRGGASGDVA
jgi:hypothetical protein